MFLPRAANFWGVVNHRIWYHDNTKICLNILRLCTFCLQIHFKNYKLFLIVKFALLQSYDHNNKALHIYLQIYSKLPNFHYFSVASLRYSACACDPFIYFATVPRMREKFVGHVVTCFLNVLNRTKGTTKLRQEG